MPRYTPEREKIENEKVVKSFIQNDLNAAAVARKRGTTPQNENKKIKRALKNPTIREVLTKEGLTLERIAKKINSLIEAIKPISCNIYVDKNGEMKNADGRSMDFVEVADNPTQIKALELLCKLLKLLDTDINIDQSQHKQTIIVYETTPDNENRNRI